MLKQQIRTIVLTAYALALIGIAPAYALDDIRSFVPTAEKVGEGRMTYMFWDVYDVTLYAPQGDWSPDKPFALQLTYLRKLDGKKIADRSIEEMRGQGMDNEVKLATWHAQLRKIFPDVDNGLRLTGVYTKYGATVFYENNTEIGKINDPEFGQAFFDIWLNEKTSAPGLRSKLLGSS